MTRGHDGVLGGLLVDLRVAPGAGNIAFVQTSDAEAVFLRGDQEAVFVLLAGSQKGWGIDERIARIKQRSPCASVFVAIERFGVNAGDLAMLARAGADDAFFLRHAGERTLLLDLIGRRLLAPPPERAMRRASELGLPRSVRPIVLWTLLNAYRRPSLDNAASAFRISRRTIARRFTAHSLPPYSELRKVGCVLHILELNVRYGLSQRQAARRVGLVDASIVSKSRARWMDGSGSAQVNGDRWWWQLPSLYER